MLQLTKGQTSENIIVTLNELTTLNEPNYLFVFRHATTKNVVSFVKLNGDDYSNYPDRYNEFNVNTNLLFGGQLRGEWDYVVYEQASTTNTDPTGLNAVEYGKMLLTDATTFSYTKYNPSTNYIAYNG